jgi:superfamily II DNA or RNA helicase
MSEFLFPIHDRATAPFAWRQYQLNAVEACTAAVKTSAGCLLILPCGVGKTEIAVRLIQTLPEAGTRAVFITHLDSLISQTAARLRLRGVACGVEQAALKSDELVTVASYKSLISRDRYAKFVGDTSLVVVDESHMNYSKRAIQILNALRDGGAKVIGMTASPDRMSGDPLTQFYGNIAYHYTLQQAIEDGWLVAPRIWLSIAGELDLSKPIFDRGQGDFSAEQLCKEMAREGNVQTVTNLVLNHHEGEPCVVFCQGILQAEKVRERLYRGGIEAALVHSNMEPDERRMNLSLFESGKLNIILNVGCLTVGWDCPIVRKLFWCKPTKSRPQYQQGIGRGTRPLNGVVDGWATAAQRRQAIADSKKPFFEVFDLVDASRHNDLQTSIEALVPEIPPEIARRVRQKAEQGGVTLTALGALIEQEQQLIEDERKRAAQEKSALDAIAERDRAAWLAGMEFRNFERPAFAQAEEAPKQRGWRVTFGRHKGTLLRDVDTGWIKWALANAKLNPAFRQACQRELGRRA